MEDDRPNRRGADLRIGHIESEVQYLREAQNKNAEAISRISEKMDSGFKEIGRALYEYKANVAKPNYLVLFAALSLVGGLAITWSNYMINPLKDEIGKVSGQVAPIVGAPAEIHSLRKNIDSLGMYFKDHAGNGHPHTTFAKIENLESTIKALINAEREHTSAEVKAVSVEIKQLRRDLDRIDYYGSSRLKMYDTPNHLNSSTLINPHSKHPQVDNEAGQD